MYDEKFFDFICKLDELKNTSQTNLKDLKLIDNILAGKIGYEDDENLKYNTSNSKIYQILQVLV